MCKKVNWCINDKDELWKLKRLDDVKNNKWYGIILLELDLTDFTLMHMKTHTLFVNILMSTHKYTQT